MNTDRFTAKRSQIGHWMWRQRLERAQGEHAGLVGSGRSVHFLLGVAGSGADHLARLITRPSVKLRLYNSPAAKFEPRLVLSKSGDRLALPYQRRLERQHPLNRIYRMLQEQENEWVSRGMSNRLDQSALAAAPCLIKESHSLLATEGLLGELKATALLYVGDPVKIVDRLFAQESLDTPYLTAEGRSVLAPYFLSRFVRKDYARVVKAYKRIRNLSNRRKGIILHRLLVVALIHHMFRMLALRNPQQAILVEYDQLAGNPGLFSGLMRRLMGQAGEDIARQVLAASTIVPRGRTEAIWKNTWPDMTPGFEFLSVDEVAACYRLLRLAGLGVGAGDAWDTATSERGPGQLYTEFKSVANG